MTTPTAMSGAASELAIDNHDRQRCPLCERRPVDPLTFHGELACASCLSTCQICTGHTSLGERICALCALIYPDQNEQGRAA